MLAEIRRLFQHAAWADAILLAAFRDQAGIPPEATRELGHILGADEIWLSRLERRPSRTAVWPDLDIASLERLAADIHRGYAAYLATLEEPGLDLTVSYTTSAGKPFTNAVKDILLHVPMHAQYHRGKVNLLLRQGGLQPAPTDYIAYIRGTPAARSS